MERRIRDYIQTEPELRWKLRYNYHPSAVHELREQSFEMACGSLERIFSREEEPAPSLQMLNEWFGSDVADELPPELALACSRIALWLDEVGRLELAVRYAELAAEIIPEQPVLETLVGRLSREAGYPLRSIARFHRAIRAATGAKDRVTRVRAILGLGIAWAQLGDYSKARELYQRAAWAAQRAGNKWLAGEVHHDLLVMAAERGDFDRAAVYALRALEAYPVHHDRFPALVYDFALLLCRQRMYSAAFPLLEVIVGKFRSDYLCTLARSAFARAAAGVRHDCYGELVRTVLGSVADDDPRYAAPLVNLAFAARTIEDWSATRECTERAMRLVRSRTGHSEEARLAKQLLRFCDERIAEEAPQNLPQRSAATDSDPILAAIHVRITERLRRWHGPTWRRKQQAGANDRGKI